MKINKNKIKMGLKRWIVLSIIGIFLLSLGLSSIYNRIGLNMDKSYTYIIISSIGIVFLIISVKNGLSTILGVVNKHKYEVDLSKNSVAYMINKEKILDKGPKIVVLGGGTGLSVLLRGLKNYTANITAVVTVADDGGGSGILREDLGMLPPGDIRNCILALADTEPTMEKLIQYRFTEGNLKGQNFGNLFIAAMNGIYGNFEMAVKEMSNVLAVSGEVLPMTLQDTTLYAKLENGKVIKGESNITVTNEKIKSRIEKVFLKPQKLKPLNETINKIREADIILLGPGSLYTSVIPNLLVENITKELEKSKATKIYINNVMTQPGETDGYSVKDHVEAIIKHSSEKIIDYVITNNESLPKNILKRYSLDGASPVLLNSDDKEYLKEKDINIIEDKLIDIKKDYIRHDAEKLTEIISNLYQGSRMSKLNFLNFKKDISKS
ncbi:YvcK family protein [Clostridium sp. D2Q-14]|uniref:gluconeogenesis factor YvcK family protein n=1 Tax=Anaeromonas gelatinilytica TaxID=2683194 RepID=UPI00193C2C49|nr:gluconeogenesis factor YvcK family protein [Anaeromonas gelatinilytica]MBS4534797.1 YvcK family protein [Anaeromonas gelatinilytica]